MNKFELKLKGMGQEKPTTLEAYENISSYIG